MTEYEIHVVRHEKDLTNFFYAKVPFILTLKKGISANKKTFARFAEFGFHPDIVGSNIELYQNGKIISAGRIDPVIENGMMTDRGIISGLHIPFNTSANPSLDRLSANSFEDGQILRIIGNNYNLQGNSLDQLIERSPLVEARHLSF